MTVCAYRRRTRSKSMLPCKLANSTRGASFTRRPPRLVRSRRQVFLATFLRLTTQWVGGVRLLDRQINSPTFTSSPSNWRQASGRQSLSTRSDRRQSHWCEGLRLTSFPLVAGQYYLQATIRIEERHAILPVLREHIMNNLVKVTATGILKV